MADIQLTKVNILSKEDHATKTGGAHYHVFIDDKTGEEVIERTTAEQHALQKGVNGSQYNPKKEGFTWSYTFGTDEYDTKSGMLEPGTYAVEGEKALIALEHEGKTKVLELDSKEVVNDVVDDTKITARVAEITALKLNG